MNIIALVERRSEWTGFHIGYFTDQSLLPLAGESRKAFLAGEQFLHRAVLDPPLLGDELLQRFDEGIRITQRPRNRFLLVASWHSKRYQKQSIFGEMWNSAGNYM